MKSDEQWLIDRLEQSDVSNEDLSSCIDLLEMLLSAEAVPLLVKLLRDEGRPYDLREQAARAIYSIGSNIAAESLNALAADQRFQKLARIAMRG